MQRSSETPSTGAAITAMQLRFMTLDELLSLYHRLAAPPFEEMHGEYAATLLEQGSGRAFIAAQIVLNIKGRSYRLRELESNLAAAR